MLSFINYDNADAALIKFFKYLSINIDPEFVTAELEKHPDYPSMLAVSDVLTALDIENSAFRIGFEELPNVPCPFMAHVNINNGGFAVVSNMEGGNFYISSEHWNNHKVSADEFKKMFAGVVLTAEPSVEFKTATTFKSILTAVKTPAILIGTLLVLALALTYHSAYFTNLSWQLLTLTLFKTAGLITSILLLIQSIDNNNPLVQTLCQSVGKTDCHAILSSKAAKIFDGLSWSEVGFFYFAGTWLLLLFGGGSILTWQALAVLNFISLPYTFYSIYYQARVAKQWCVLCCTVQALLWLEFVPLAIYIYKNPLSSLSFKEGRGEALSRLFICLLVPVLLWILLKPLFLKLQQLPTLKQQLRKFKYNAELFNKLLTDQSKYTPPDEEWSIVLGNVEANNIVTMVTNPYCPPCSKMHKLLDELLEQNGNVQARIVFTADNTENDRKTPVSRHMMALNELPDKTKLKQALHDWYEQKQKNYEAWAKVYPVQLIEENFHKLDKQKDWCKMAEVTATPTMLLNGYRLPELYQLPDLKYMLE